MRGGDASRGSPVPSERDAGIDAPARSSPAGSLSAPSSTSGCEAPDSAARARDESLDFASPAWTRENPPVRSGAEAARPSS